MTTTLLPRPSFPLSTMRDPFGAMEDEMRNWISQFDENGFTLGRVFPTLDISETDNLLEVKMDVPGVNADEIDVQVNNQMLTISGSRKSEKEEKGKTFHRAERRFGSFSRSVTLPCEVNEKEVDAVVHDGVLTVTLPKSEETKSKKIKVKPR